MDVMVGGREGGLIDEQNAVFRMRFAVESFFLWLHRKTSEFKDSRVRNCGIDG